MSGASPAVSMRKFTTKTLAFALAIACVSGSSAQASSGGVSPSGGPPSSASSTTFSRVLAPGDWGADVRKLQTWLVDLGYRVQTSGYYDRRTQTAVRRFQRAHHLTPASGTVGSRTASALLAAVRKAGYTTNGVQAMYNPIPGFQLGRDDMGVDASAGTGAPIYAPVASRLVQVMQDWYAGQPLLLFQFLHQPSGAWSDYWYVAEQVSPATTRIGATFRAGQPVGWFASSGTGIEIGWGSPTSNSRTLAGASDPGAANPPYGATTRWGESFKHFFGIR